MRYVLVEVFTSPDSPYCNIALQVVRRVAQDHGESVVLKEVSLATREGKEKARLNKITAVPATVVNEKYGILGIPSERKLAQVIEKELNSSE